MYVMRYAGKKQTVLSVTASLVYTICSVAFLYQVKGFSQVAQNAELRSQVTERVLYALLLMIASCGFLMLQRRINDVASNRFQQRIRDDLFHNLQKGSYTDMSKRGFASVSTNMIQDAGACAELIFGSIAGSLTAVFFWVIIFGIMAAENFAVFSMIFLCALALSLFAYFFRKSIGRIFSEYGRCRELLNRKINEMLRCRNMLKAAGTCQEERRILAEESAELKTAYLKCNVTVPIVFSSIEIAILLSYFIIFFLPRNTEAVFSITTAQLALFATYIPQLWQRYSALSSIFSNFVAADQYSERLKEGLTVAEGEEKKDQKYQSGIEPVIRAEGLHFSFGESVILNDLSFEFRNAGLIYVCGKSGSGKSTLFNIMTGLFRDYTGHFTLGGYEIKNLTAGCLEENIGIVHQNPFVLKGTALYNIRLFDEKITEKEILDVAEKYGLAELLGDLNACEFSHGQERVISILRVLVRDPRILLLDEITANLDSYTETKIDHLVSELSKRRLCFIIEHKSSRIPHEKMISIGSS